MDPIQAQRDDSPASYLLPCVPDSQTKIYPASGAFRFLNDVKGLPRVLYNCLAPIYRQQPGSSMGCIESCAGIASLKPKHRANRVSVSSRPPIEISGRSAKKNKNLSDCIAAVNALCHHKTLFSGKHGTVRTVYALNRSHITDGQNSSAGN